MTLSTIYRRLHESTMATLIEIIEVNYRGLSSNKSRATTTCTTLSTGLLANLTVASLTFTMLTMLIDGRTFSVRESNRKNLTR